jgi:predicted ATPase with chaperone activity
LGELSLDGSLNPVAGVLPAAIGASARELGLICAAPQGGEAAWAGSLEVLAAPDLLSVINHFRGDQMLEPPRPAGVAEGSSTPDLAEVKGMETARRALEIAAAGGHNLLLIGPPLEALRQPMESGRTPVARATAHITYPARFQLVAAMNPCRCGHLGDSERECGRAPRCGEDYQNRISGPLLDRIDLTVEVQPVAPAELIRAPTGEPSRTVAGRVATARRTQRARFGEDGPATNAEAGASAIELPAEAAALAERAAEKLRLSARGFTRILRVSRTVADLAEAAAVRRQDVAEALAFRHRVFGRTG